MTDTALRKYERLTNRSGRGGDPFQPDRELPLWSLDWDDERTDLHGIVCTRHSYDAQRALTLTLSCYCGQAVEASTEDDAFSLLIAHATGT